MRSGERCLPGTRQKRELNDMSLASRMVELLGLSKQPVAVQFRDAAPAGVSRIDRAAASGCTYWKLASEGQTFYTEAPDHYGCPIGSHTHGIELPADVAKELEGLIGTMVELEYLSMDEVPGIPRREKPFGVAVYAPLADSRCEADVVLVCGNARQMMLLGEAAHAVGLSSESSLAGRPTCAAIPAVLRSGQAATNLGCIGNRVYTELADDDLYFAFAGSRLESIVGKLSKLVNANRELESFHRGRVSERQ